MRAMRVVTHCAAPSGTGTIALCGAKNGEIVVSRKLGEVTCPACAALATLTGSGKQEQLELPGIPPKPNSHYDAGGVAAIDVIRAKLTAEQFKGFLLGNAIKYSLRLNHKGSPESDAYKLAEYSTWLREAVTLEKKA